jgi:hypothetical protein
MANDNNGTADEFVPKDAIEAQAIRLICRKLCEAEVHMGEAAFEATTKEEGLKPDFGRVEGLCAAAICAVGEAHLALCGLFPADAHIEAVRRDLYPPSRRPQLPQGVVDLPAYRAERQQQGHGPGCECCLSEPAGGQVAGRFSEAAPFFPEALTTTRR